MQITLTRFNMTRAGYDKRDDRPIGLSQAGEDELNELIEQVRTKKRAPRAISFSEWDEGAMSGATWRRATAVQLAWRLETDTDAGMTQVFDAARQLQVGFLAINACERDGTKTIVVVFPLSEPVGKERYARLAGVLADQMRILGVKLAASSGTLSHTHLLHLHRDSIACWFPGPALSPKDKIASTRTAFQDLDYRRLQASAVDAQVDKPVFTACDDGLFDWG